MRLWLKRVRNSSKLTQEEIALKSNISRSYYTHIESGTKNPTVSTAKSIANTLGFEWTLFFEEECSLKEQNDRADSVS